MAKAKSGIHAESPGELFGGAPSGTPNTWQRLWQGPEEIGGGRNFIPRQKRFWGCGFGGIEGWGNSGGFFFGHLPRLPLEAVGEGSATLALKEPRGGREFGALE